MSGYLQAGQFHRVAGGRVPLENVLPPLEKCVGNSLKILGPSENSSPPLVSPTGYRPACKENFISAARAYASGVCG